MSLSVCVVAHSSVDAIGLWKSPVDFGVCFHYELMQSSYLLAWSGGTGVYFEFCLNFVPLTTIKSVTFDDNCVKTLKR